MEFLDRLKIERLELSKKIDKLSSFLNSEDINKITKLQKSLLTIQLDAMYTYHTCLNERIKNLLNL